MIKHSNATYKSKYRQRSRFPVAIIGGEEEHYAFVHSPPWHRARIPRIFAEWYDLRLPDGLEPKIWKACTNLPCADQGQREEWWRTPQHPRQTLQKSVVPSSWSHKWYQERGSTFSSVSRPFLPGLLHGGGYQVLLCEIPSWAAARARPRPQKHCQWVSNFWPSK